MEEIKLCKYNCGNEAKFQLKSGQWICEKNFNSCPAIKEKNRIQANLAYKEGRLCTWKKGWENGKIKNWNQGLTKKEHQGLEKISNKLSFKLKDILEGKYPEYQSRKLKNKLYEENIKQKQCEICFIKNWNEKEIIFELHHIDGNSKNHLLNNLQILCPNCHSQTNNFRNKKRMAS